MIVSHPAWWVRGDVCKIDPQSQHVGVCANGALAIAAGRVPFVAHDKEHDILIYNLDKALTLAGWTPDDMNRTNAEDGLLGVLSFGPNEMYANNLNYHGDTDFYRAGKYVLRAMNADVYKRGMTSIPDCFDDIAEGNDRTTTTPDDMIRWFRLAARAAKRSLKRQQTED